MQPAGSARLGSPAPSRSRRRKPPAGPSRLAVHDRTDREARPSCPRPRPGDVWIVLPTYNEAENVGPITAAILDALPTATVLVVGRRLARRPPGDWPTRLASTDPRIRVRPSIAQAGSRSAPTWTAFGVALSGGATTVVQMDADFSHAPAALPGLVAPIADDTADLVIGLALHAGRRRPSIGGSVVGSCRAAAASSRGSCWVSVPTT